MVFPVDLKILVSLSWIIGRHFQKFYPATDAVCPKHPVFIQYRSVQMPIVPSCIVLILDLRRLNLNLAAVFQVVVPTGNVVQDDSYRPAIGHKMVQDYQQVTPVVVDGIESYFKKTPGGEI